MKRRKIVAGNWKMNLSYEEGIELVEKLAKNFNRKRPHVVICAPFIHLKELDHIFRRRYSIKVGAQNCHYEKKGAFTGEISAEQLKSCGVEYVIVGHSERRQYFNESNDVLMKKVRAVLDAGLTPIFCCGESLDIRNSGKHLSFVEEQLQDTVFALSTQEIPKVVIAYEPIWAIGTGMTASPDQAQEMHKRIRRAIADHYDDVELSKSISILYGGSVTAANALEIFEQKDVDGGLVGGASLKADEFLKIIYSI